VAYKEKKDKSFYPDYLIEIVFSIAICIEILLILSFLFSPSIGRMIDFTRPYHPMPEWYFLWLYRLVRYFPAELSVIGTFIIPLALFLLLLFIPYIDKGKQGRLKAIIVGIFLLLFFIIFSFISFL
jgi:quinol-cytochrome oxidoreductase complex cytochrome b subunit